VAAILTDQDPGCRDPGREAFLARTPRPAHGRVVATHLGVGLADVILGSAILDRAESMGLGTLLD